MTGRGLRRFQLGMALSSGLLLVMAVAGTAAAAKPDKAPAPSPDGIVDETCGFPIEVRFPTNDQFAITFFDQAGNPTRVIVAGKLVATLTNMDTDESITVNISGPLHMNFVRGTNTSEGRWSVWPDGTLHIAAGRTDNVDGSFRGHVVMSVCDVLAPGA